MSKEKFNDLIEKYEQGNTSLDEEQIIFDNADNFASGFQAWFKFIQLNRKKAPKGLQDSIWESIHRKRIINQRLRITTLSAAASILLLLGIAIYKPFGNNQSYRKKEALLNEAIGMFENKEPKAVVKPIYEDEMIIIFVSAE